MTETEVLTRINHLKIRHEVLKKEILDHFAAIEIHEREMANVEEEYVGLIAKMMK